METDKKDFDLFRGHLEASDEAVVEAAKCLCAQGYTISRPPTSVAPSRAECLQHVDNGDLFVHMRLEVKHLSANFTGLHDWPFPDFIVCSKNSYDRANPKPYAYWIWNKARTHVAIVGRDSFKRWEPKEKTDRRYNNMTQDFYHCPLEDVYWMKVEDNHDTTQPPITGHPPLPQRQD